MRTTYGSPAGYWIIGALILWLMVPVAVVDLVLAPDWHAPNPQCDSLGIPIMEALAGLLPTGILAVIITAPVFLLGRKRTAGADILDWRLGTPPWNWIVTLLALTVVAYIAFDIGQYIWQVAIPQTFSADCDGRAEQVTVTMRAPALQLFPFWEIAFGAWVLHVRALLLATRIH